MKSDGNVYVHGNREVIILAYVDDLMIFGNPSHVKDLQLKLEKAFLLKQTGDLNSHGAKVKFIGRQLQRQDSGIVMYGDENYYQDILKDMDMLDCKPASTPSIQTSSTDVISENAVDSERRELYRRVVGKLQWQHLMRPDIAYAVKELARDLTAPTEQ